ncbi:MAG: hypothetical protein U9N35_06565 [Euryarchaeota archaeon]|nr:hypothetical protein [Euryarchaeota archaeon]
MKTKIITSVIVCIAIISLLTPEILGNDEQRDGDDRTHRYVMGEFFVAIFMERMDLK